MALTVAQFQDLITSTLNDLGPMKWTDLTLDLNELTAMPELLQKEKVQFADGVAIQRTVMVDHQHSAKAVGLFADDDVNVRDQYQTIEAPWRHVTANFGLERREISMNRGGARIFDLIKGRRDGMMISLSERMEAFFWTQLSSDDGVQPFPVQYWANKYASGSTTGGFNSGLPWTATYPGGLNHARWKNWTAQYTNVTKADLVAKMKRGARRTHFKSPIKMPSYDRGPERRAFYTTIANVEEFETLGEQQNDNLGRDVAPYMDEIAFRRNPIRWVPQLDDDDDVPVYQIDWSKFYIAFLSGEYMNESGPDKDPDCHTAQRVFIDCTYNTVCHDVRALAVYSKDTDKS